jgi:hypothetical protein
MSAIERFFCGGSTMTMTMHGGKIQSIQFFQVKRNLFDFSRGLIEVTTKKNNHLQSIVDIQRLYAQICLLNFMFYGICVILSDEKQ